MAEGRRNHRAGLVMIVISPNLVLSPTPTVNPDNPLIGWHNVLEPGTLTADEADPDFPVDNLANPATFLFWRAETTNAQDIVAEINAMEDVDYVGIASHNLGSQQITVQIEGSTNGGSTFDVLVPSVTLGDDSPALFRIPPAPYTHIKISLGEALDSPPQIAVLYIGRLLVLERRLYVGHAPMKYSREIEVTHGESENGQFLGRIVISRTTRTTIDLENLTPTWVRQELVPFLLAAEETPFFFAWRPQTYPHEVGYAWLTNNPRPVNQRPNGMMSVSLELTGIV